MWAIGGADSERIAAVPRHSEIKPGTVRAICKEVETIVVGGDVAAGPLPRETIEQLMALGDRGRGRPERPPGQGSRWRRPDRSARP